MAISFRTNTTGNVVITDNNHEFTATIDRNGQPLDICAWKGILNDPAELIIASTDQESGNVLEGITLSVAEAKALRDHLNSPEASFLFGGDAA